MNQRNPVGKLREMISDLQKELKVPAKLNLSAKCMYFYLAYEYGTILVSLGYLKMMPGGKGSGRCFSYVWNTDKEVSDEEIKEMVKIYNKKRKHDRLNLGGSYTRVSLKQVLKSHTK